MDQSRRDFIKMSATVVGGASLGIQINANAQDGQAGSKVSVKSMKPLAGQFGHRFATCIFEENSAPCIGIILDDGRVIDLVAEAKRQGMTLGFSGNSMISLIASGDIGMAQVNALTKMPMPRLPD